MPLPSAPREIADRKPRAECEARRRDEERQGPAAMLHGPLEQCQRLICKICKDDADQPDAKRAGPEHHARTPDVPEQARDTRAAVESAMPYRTPMLVLMSGHPVRLNSPTSHDGHSATSVNRVT